MISLKHNFLFIHIPKTAGNSIQNILKDYSENKIVCIGPHQDGIERFEVKSDRFKIHKHSTLAEYRMQLSDDTFRNIFKFTCVRNPWDRAISFYFSPHRGLITWDRNQFIKFLDNIPPIGTYISANLDYDFSPNYYNNIDYFIRFENLSKDFQKVCDLIGIPWVPLSVRNKSDKMHYANYYDEELIELVRKKYLDEIMFFEYEYK